MMDIAFPTELWQHFILKHNPRYSMIKSLAETYASRKLVSIILQFSLHIVFSTGRQCQDEDDMRKLVEDFYLNFNRTYKIMRKKNKNLIKVNKKSNQFVKRDLDSADLW